MIHRKCHNLLEAKNHVYIFYFHEYRYKMNEGTNFKLDLSLFYDLLVDVYIFDKFNYYRLRKQ